MSHLLLYLLTINIFTTYAQNDTNRFSYSLEINNKFDFESNSLGVDFFQDVLYGGFITDQEKNTWLNNITEENVINFEIINSIKIKSNNNKNLFFLEISDKNLANISFTDDILGLILKGNYYYESDTLKFDNTSNICPFIIL